MKIHEDVINGFKILAIPTHHRLCTVRCIINAGSSSEEKHGVAHYLEHMTFRGTKFSSCRDLSLRMSKIGDYNAYTYFDKSVYYIITTPLMIDDGIKTLCELIFSCSLPNKEFKKEKDIILEELQSSNDDNYDHYVNSSLQRLCGLYDILGNIKSIPDITIEDLINYKSKFYTTNNMIFVIIGNISDIKKSINIFKKYINKFSTISSNNTIKTIECKISHKDHNLKHRSKQAIAGIWWPWFDKNTIINNKCAHKVFLNLLGTSSHSLLYDNIREKRGLAYNTGCSTLHANNVNLLLEYAVCSPKNIPKITDLMIKSIKKIADMNFQDDLLDTSIKNSIYGITQGNEHLGSTSGLIDDWFNIKRENFKSISTENLCRFCLNIKKKDLAEIAQKILNNQHSVITQNG